MAHRSTARGITYIEVMVALSLLMLLGIGIAPVSWSWYRSVIARSGRSTLLVALRHARAESLDGDCEGSICQTGAPHGLSIQPGRFVIFQGGSYASRDTAYDEVFDSASSLQAASSAATTEVVFAALTADVAAPADFVLKDRNERVSTTSIGRLGEISQAY